MKLSNGILSLLFSSFVFSSLLPSLRWQNFLFSFYYIYYSINSLFICFYFAALLISTHFLEGTEWKRCSVSRATNKARVDRCQSWPNKNRTLWTLGTRVRFTLQPVNKQTLTLFFKIALLRPILFPSLKKTKKKLLINNLCRRYRFVKRETQKKTNNQKELRIYYSGWSESTIPKQ